MHAPRNNEEYQEEGVEEYYKFVEETCLTRITCIYVLECSVVEDIRDCFICDQCSL